MLIRKNELSTTTSLSFHSGVSNKKLTDFFGSTFIATVVFALFIGLGFLFYHLSIKISESEYFLLKNISIEGNVRLDRMDVLQASGLVEGANTFSLSIMEIERNLLKNTWVRTVSVKRQLPDKLNIIITEHEPLFFVLNNGELYYTDTFANPIAKVSKDLFVSCPLLMVEQGAEHYMPVLTKLREDINSSKLAWNFTDISTIRLSKYGILEISLAETGTHFQLSCAEYDKQIHNIMLTLFDLQQRNENLVLKNVSAVGQNVWITHKGKL